jgi:hypothetical protein
MASGTLENLAHSAFVPTRLADAERICHNLLAIPAAPYTVLDPTSGEGHLLVPFAANPRAQLYGVELSAERAAESRTRLPRAMIVTSPFENVRIVDNTVDLVVSNPPYMIGEFGRLEYAIIRDVTAALRPGNPHITIVPARQWDGTMARFWARHYERVQCWMLEADEFAKYTQIVVAGVKRAAPLASPDPLELNRIRGFRYRLDPEHPAKSPWAQGFAPVVLPDAPIADPYLVTPGGELVEITVLKADQAELLRGLDKGGAHLTPAWQSATMWQAAATLEQPLMPISGESYLAALILTGTLDGEELEGPDGQWYTFATHIASEWASVEVDEEMRKKGVTSVQQQQDKPCLSVLNLVSGELTHYQRDEVFTFLRPWLAILAQRVLHQYNPIYDLNPPDWMLRVAMTIAQDKTLPGAAMAGLQSPQLHRSFAGYTALCETGRFAINGEPGTGKTRMHILIMALFAYTWQHRHVWEGKRPTWVKGVRRAWQANPRTIGDAPRALPLAVMTPMRVVPVWEKEIAGAWPEAEVLVIDDHSDVRHWMDRCAVSDAPAVIAIFSQSKTRAFGRAWQPAVLSKGKPVKVFDLKPAPELLPELEPVTNDKGKLVAYTVTATGAFVMKDDIEYTFRCPDCNSVVEAEPGSLRKKRAGDTASAEAKADDSEARREPVRSITWFEDRRRTCDHCGAPLWTDARIKPTQAKYPQIPFNIWSTAVDAPRIDDKTSTPLDGATSTRARRRTPAMVRIVDAAGNRGAVAPDSFSPYDYWNRFYRGCCAFVEIDESHNLRGQSTDIAHSGHLAQLASQTFGYGSGTHYGGILTDFYHYWYRYNPRFWQCLGLGWNEAEKAMSRYGVIQTITKEHESSARRGSGKTDVSITTIPAPGISTRLLPYLLADLAFIDVLDVGAFMPPREETPVVVEMDDDSLRQYVEDARHALTLAEADLAEASQARDDTLGDPSSAPDEREAATAALDTAAMKVEQARMALTDARAWVTARDLKGAYHEIEGALRAKAEKRNEAARLAQGTLPRWWSILPMWEKPPFTVSETHRGDWGDVEEVIEIFRAPALSSDHIYPLERELRRIVAAEVAAGRPVMVYIEQNDIRSTADRLMHVLADFEPWTLPNSVDAEDREDAINAAVDAGYIVLLVPYRRVLEGLNLQKVKTILWYELAMNLFMLDQASRRSWRLGQDTLVRLYYLAYKGTATHRQMIRLGTKSGAAALFAGNTPDGELAKAAGADKTTLARLSKGLEADEEIDLAAAFKRRGEELAAKLARGREWIGASDTLAARLAARVVPTPVVEAILGADTTEVWRETPAPTAPLGLDVDVVPVAHEPLAELVTAHAEGKLPTVTFGNIDDMGAVLRKQRRQRRAASVEAMQASGQLALF